ncbi:MAG: deoxyribodipyrimidine photolyase [Deltaproteobacteria bacterium]|nr:MAG: deoxyribodipyrimidine photolyase [Deltaproteobacteria bacterium]
MEPARIPQNRVVTVNDAPIAPKGEHVVYWMIGQRRSRWNFALQHAIARATSLGVPLIVLEALRVGYPWASDRLHRFVLDGMADNRRRFADSPVAHHAYVERTPGEGAGLLAALAERAALVVTDDVPFFFLPRMVRAAGAKLRVRLEAVDGNGLVPLRTTAGAFPTAHAFRRFLQRELRPHLASPPLAEPLTLARSLPPASVPASVLARWPAAPDAALDGSDPAFLAGLPIDHEVPPSPIRGGSAAAEAALAAFLDGHLAGYGQDRNHPDEDGASGLSPYLHFGHVSPHEVVSTLLAREGWTPARLSASTTGSRTGWWGVGPGAESFLDQIVTWRELGFVFAFHRPDHAEYDGLPDWARATLEEHVGDRRPWRYTREQLERAETHDEVWNAAQMQLRVEGRVHNYLRMLWGKKVLEWSAHPREAFHTLVALNDRWALDGRDPNSYSGIGWCLGRFDRAWGPERAIFGKIRYMSSENTKRKLHLQRYLARWGGR